MLEFMDDDSTRLPPGSTPLSRGEPGLASTVLQTTNSGQRPWRGYLELARRDWICGWAQDLDAPDAALTLRIDDNGVPLGEVIANQYREDLEASGIGDGRHAFALTVPGGLDPAVRHLIRARRIDDGREIDGSPRVIEAAAAFVMSRARSAPHAAWRGQVEIATRLRLEGWAWDERAPDAPVALVILVNGDVIARVLANRYRKDLLQAGIGDGRHAFALHIPGGLSPSSRHVIQVLGEGDGCEMPGSPWVIEAAASFDAALEHAVAAALAALSAPEQRARALHFLAVQSELLLQQSADADSGREASLVERQRERRLGRARHAGELEVPVGTSSRRRALVIDERLPSANPDAAVVLSHMRALQALDFEVSFVAAEEASPPTESAKRSCDELSAVGVRVCRNPYYASVEEVLRRQRGDFDLVYLNRLSSAQKYLGLVRHCARRARVLLRLADLQSVRLERRALVDSRPEFTTQCLRVRRLECAAAAAADVVLTDSAAEARWLREAIDGVNVHLVPWSVPLRSIATPWRERAGVAFIGDFGLGWNVDAARHLATVIMPLVWRENPSIDCVLVGGGAPHDIERLAAPRVVVLRDACDCSAIFERVRLTVAPLRFGAGVGTGVLDSLAAGVPCVMSSGPAEGLGLPPSLTTVADTPEGIALLILDFHRNETRAVEYSRAARSFMGEVFAEATVRERLQAAIDPPRAVQRTEVHR
jgi:hypothetical protein